MSTDFVIRLIGMIVFFIVGISWGISLGEQADINPFLDPLPVEMYGFTLGLVGALFGLILTPIITIRPIRAIRLIFSQISARSLFAALVGLAIGLTIAALLAFPLSLLPPPFGSVLPFGGVLIFGYMGVALFIIRQDDLYNVISSVTNRDLPSSSGEDDKSDWSIKRNILLDTSVVIDGRIADIARTGFLPGTLIVPRFVLSELQSIADSPDSLRRQRGRRGMEVLTILQKDPSTNIMISDIDIEDAHDVDDKLVILARQMRHLILTNDYNLNRIAELQGVTVLNVNELANAVKTVLLPGESINIRVIQEGKEEGQGVGYMDDGTMVVVEGGKRFQNRKIGVTVTKVLQTAAGRMIFARPETRN